MFRARYVVAVHATTLAYPRSKRIEDVPTRYEFRASAVGTSWQGPIQKRKRTIRMKDKKQYYRMKNKQSLNIRLNAEERSALEIQMMEEGWEKIATFVKYQLGLLQEKGAISRQIINSGKPEEIAILVKNAIRYLAETIEYYNDNNAAYLRELSQYSNWQLWEKASETNRRVQAKIIALFKQTLSMTSGVIKALGIKDGVYDTKDFPVIDVKNATKKDLDTLAAQIYSLRP